MFFHSCLLGNVTISPLNRELTEQADLKQWVLLQIGAIVLREQAMGVASNRRDSRKRTSHRHGFMGRNSPKESKPWIDEVHSDSAE